MKPEKQLYQWDVNQYLTGINPSAQFVDYPIEDEVIRIEADGNRCRIPDEVLQTYGGKTCYERYPDGTFRAYSFSVLYAPKPPDYVYTPEERTTFEALTARVDAAINEIKRRADSGEFTPKKGVDYFTDAEKAEMMESVSSGAVGEFRKVVDTATTEYNANAAEKLTTYDTNAEQHTTDYNRNAAEKLEAYNQNHTAKVAEYNQNAETKTAEFDSNAAALQTEVDRLRGEFDHLATEKANVDGYYEEMTVGDAEQLIATQFVEDNEPYGYRTTGDSADVGNRAYLDKIVGGTVAWNQLVEHGNFDAVSGWSGGTVSGNVLTITGTSDGMMNLTLYRDINIPSGHKTLAMCDVYCGSANAARIRFPFNSLSVVSVSANIWTSVGQIGISDTSTRVGIQMNAINGETYKYRNFVCFDITQMFGSTIADYIYSLEQSQAGAGVAWFKKLFPKDYYAYNAGELLSVGGLQSHNTVGFNQWDGTSENGRWVSDYTTGAVATASNVYNVTNLIRVLPNTAYYHSQTDSSRIIFYDSDKNAIPMSGWQYSDGAGVITAPQNARYVRFTVTNSRLSTFCINLSDPSRNGEYEPYEKHSYPLDSSLTLRGIPKLDASNNLYYDGDEYASDGKVKRKYGVLTPTTAELEENTYYANLLGVPCWEFNMPSDMKGYDSWDDKNAIADKIVVRKYAKGVTNCIIIDAGPRQFVYASSTGVTAEQARDFIRSLTFVYELATPTTETAEPFQNIQVVDDFGTEEFVSNGLIPVGHVTRYPANLRDKLQHLPDLASIDGTYLIQQSGKQMSLIHMPAVFPNTPTEDGTYTLKTVVTGGVATLQWVAE